MSKQIERNREKRVNEKDGEIVQLKNRLAALESKKFQGEMDQKSYEAKIARKEKLLKTEH